MVGKGVGDDGPDNWATSLSYPSAPSQSVDKDRVSSIVAGGRLLEIGIHSSECDCSGLS